MIINNISEAKTHLSSLIQDVINGQEVIIGKFGKPIVKLVPYQEKKRPKRVPGALKNKIKIADDFDELPSELNSYFGI